jgi:hypothetical protein
MTCHSSHRRVHPCVWISTFLYILIALSVPSRFLIPPCVVVCCVAPRAGTNEGHIPKTDPAARTLGAGVLFRVVAQPGLEVVPFVHPPAAAPPPGRTGEEKPFC